MGYLLYNGKLVTGEGIKEAAIFIDGEKISRIIPADKLEDGFPKNHTEYETIDLNGKLVFAGGIDAHVHFREPGLTHKADIGTESLAAVKGGITSFIDMPNTKPATVTASALAEKLALAEGRAFANYGFHLGATNDNFQEIETILETGKDGISRKDFGGIKVFMGSSTGNMLVDDDETLRKIFGIKEKEILVHCEDEETVRENFRKAEEEFGDAIPFERHPAIRSRKACILSSVNITAETSANYLWFTDQEYHRLGAMMKCNPAIKTPEDRQALRQALRDGVIDTVGSDHAPHMKEEKDRKYPVCPSGVPSIQQSLQVLLTVADEEDIPLSRIASAFSEKAADIFGIKDRGYLKEGYYADLAIVDMDAVQTVTSEGLAYKCGWSPYENETLKGVVTDVFVNGQRVVKDSVQASMKPFGQRLVFEK